MGQSESLKHYILFTLNCETANHTCSQEKMFFTANISHEIKAMNPFSNLNCYNANCSSKSYLPILEICTYKMNLSRVIKKAALHLWGSRHHFFILLFIRRKHSFSSIYKIHKYHYFFKKKKKIRCKTHLEKAIFAS